MRSFILVVATLAAALAAEAGYTSTVIDISTVTVYSCGPNVSCVGQHSSTPTVLVNSATSLVEVATTSCLSTLSNVSVPSVIVSAPTDSITSISVAIPPISYGVPTSVAETTGPVATVTVEVSSVVAETPVAPTSVAPGVTGPIILNGTSIVPNTDISSGILTESGTPTGPITSTSVIVIPHQTTVGPAPSSSATAPNAGGRMVVPTLMLGLLALGGYIFA